MIDIALISIPLARRIVPSAPAKLKSVLQKEGIICTTIDLNMDFYKTVKEDDLWHRGLNPNMEDDKHWDKFLEVSEKCMEKLKDISPKFIGLSVFGHNKSFKFVTEITKLLRKQLPHVKIIIGGNAVPVKNFGKDLFEQGLVDYYVIGEGEITVVEILKGELNIPGVNGVPPNQIKDLNSLPLPDYSDFNLSDYPKDIYVEGSRGCIFRCNFCRRIVPRYTYKRSDKIIEEIIWLYNSYGYKNILFGDAVSNGSLTEFKEFCKKIISLKGTQDLPDDFEWSCSINVLPSHLMNEEFYILLKASGCSAVTFGVESGSYKVRRDMNKNIKDEDIDFVITQCDKNDIYASITFMVGYITETEEDFIKTLKFVENYNPSKEGTVGLVLGPTYSLEDGTDLWDKRKEMGITFDENNNWIYKNNTMKVRVKRWMRLKELTDKLNYNVDNKSERYLKNYVE